MYININIEQNDKPENIKALGESLIKLSESFIPQEHRVDYVNPPATVSSEPALKGGVGVTPVDTDAEVTPDGKVNIDGGEPQEPVYSEQQDVDATAPADDNITEGEFDSSGFPHDARIHAGTKTTNNDGTWKLRRKPKELTDEQWKQTIDQVRAEFTGGNTQEQQPAATDVGFTQGVQTDAQQMVHQTAQTGAAQNAVVANEQQQGVANEQQQLTWPQVLQRTAAAKQAGTINDETINGVLQGFGIASFPLLAPRQDLFQQFLTSLGI